MKFVRLMAENFRLLLNLIALRLKSWLVNKLLPSMTPDGSVQSEIPLTNLTDYARAVAIVKACIPLGYKFSKFSRTRFANVYGLSNKDSYIVFTVTDLMGGRLGNELEMLLEPEIATRKVTSSPKGVRQHVKPFRARR